MLRSRSGDAEERLRSDLFLKPGGLLPLSSTPLFLLPPLLLLPRLSHLLCLALKLLLSLRSLLCFAPSHFLLGEPAIKEAAAVWSVLLLWDQTHPTRFAGNPPRLLLSLPALLLLPLPLLAGQPAVLSQDPAGLLWVCGAC